jgi:hypothetical protein
MTFPGRQTAKASQVVTHFDSGRRRYFSPVFLTMRAAARRAWWSRKVNIRHGIVLSRKPLPISFSSTVWRPLSTLLTMNEPLCPKAATRSPIFGIRFFATLDSFSQGRDDFQVSGFQMEQRPVSARLTKGT